MRRAQSRKSGRFSGLLFFAAFSWAGIGMGLDVKNGLIAKDFGAFLKNKLNTVFVDKEIKLSGIEGGGFRKLTIDDLAVFRKANGSPILSVDKIIVKYSLLNLALRQFEKLGGVYLISPSLFFEQNQFPLSDRRDFPAREYLSNASAYTGKPLKFQILNGSITVLGRPPILKNLEGQVSVYNAGLKLNKVKGNFLGIPVTVSGRVDNVMERPAVKLRLTAKDKYYSVSCAFKNSGEGPEGRVWGTARIFDKFQTRFKGVVNAEAGQAIGIKKLVLTNPFAPRAVFSIAGNISLSDGSSEFIVDKCIRIIASADKGKGLSIYAKISHLNFLGRDILSEININSQFCKMAGSRQTLKGYLKTQNLILDYKPFKEVELKWVIKDREFFITDFQLGDSYRMSGKVKLSKPYQADLALSINNAELGDWFIFLNPFYPVSISGLVSGKIKVEGPIAALSTNGRLNIKEGNINEVKFNAIHLNLKGKGPVVAVSDSRIFKDGGFLRMDGEIDLRKFGRRNILEDMKITTDQKVIVWDGWDITKSPSEIMARKGVSDNMNVNFKTYVTAGNKSGMDEDDDKKSEIGLDYRIKKDDSINVRMKKDSAFVGVEHKMRF